MTHSFSATRSEALLPRRRPAPSPHATLPPGLRVAVALIALAGAACSSATEPRRPVAELTALPRELSAAEKGVRDASNGFALSLLQKTSAAQPGENVFVSPLSVSTSLGMALNGARGETSAQMRLALGYGAADLAAINAGYRELTHLLRGLDASTSFQIANSIWYHEPFPVLPGFLDAGRTHYDAEIRGVDFTQAEATKTAVNAWVKAKTNGRIPEIVDEVRADDVMYLINAIWFKGSWRSRFDPKETTDASFTTASGASQTVRMMTQEVDSTAGFRHYADASVQAGELPYGNGAYAMTILLPPEGTHIDEFVATLTPARWSSVIGGLQERRGWFVSIPRFTLTYQRELSQELKALGMTDAFAPSRADFSGISAGGGLYVGFVMHKTFVQVDEEGTEAAAVTNTGVRVVSMPPSFRVDRPFVFAIRERLSGTVLFIGKMARIP